MDRDRQTRRDMRLRYAAFRVAGYSMLRSAIEAGYSAKGATSRADKLERRQDVQERMQLLREGYLTEELKRTEVGRMILAENAKRNDHESVIKTLARRIVRDDLEVILFDPANVIDVVGNNVSVKDFDAIKKKHRRVISKISSKPGEFGSTVTIEFHSKDAAKQRFLNYFGPTAKVEVAKLIAEVRKKPDDDGEDTQVRAQVIYEIPHNGRTYEDKAKG